MKWLSNIYDPRRSDARFRVTCRSDETQNDAWNRQKEWLRGKTIGEPVATQYCNVEQLKTMHMVGVYAA